MTSHKVVTAEYICYFTWIVSSHRRQEWVKGGGGGGCQTGEWMTVVDTAVSESSSAL